MIDVAKMIQEKYPKLHNHPIIQKALTKFADSLVHQEQINQFIAELCKENGIIFCDFNIDQDFADCIDSFIVVAIDKIKEKNKKHYLIED